MKTTLGSLLVFFLSELLKRFMDKESIVQEASCTSFHFIVESNSEKLVDYISDIFKIISMVFEKYTGNSQLMLYDTISLMTEHFEDSFTNIDIVQELFVCIIKRWFDINNLSTEQISRDSNSLMIFELLSNVLKVSANLLSNYFNDFMNGSIKLIENNFTDKDILMKSLDLLSTLCQVFPELMKYSEKKEKIVEIVYKIFTSETNNDLLLKQYVLALVGDLCKVDTQLLKNNIDFFINILIENLELPTSKSKIQIDRVSVCNNSCWSIGLLALTYKENVRLYVKSIMAKITNILKAPKMNKSLAQNIAICIGRIAFVIPEEVSGSLDIFIKQFCVSMKLVTDSEEKQQAFSGLCSAILYNPSGIMNHFAFFCDAICQYSNAPPELEQLFQNIILSYKNLIGENWNQYFNAFPEKLKMKMGGRFNMC